MKRGRDDSKNIVPPKITFFTTMEGPQYKDELYECGAILEIQLGCNASKLSNLMNLIQNHGYDIQEDIIDVIESYYNEMEN